MLESGTIIYELKEPIKQGYLFISWHTDRLLNVKLTLPLTVSDNLTLYAMWISIASYNFTLTLSVENPIISQGQNFVINLEFMNNTENSINIIHWYSIFANYTDPLAMVVPIIIDCNIYWQI